MARADRMRTVLRTIFRPIADLELEKRFIVAVENSEAASDNLHRVSRAAALDGMADDR